MAWLHHDRLAVGGSLIGCAETTSDGEFEGVARDETAGTSHTCTEVLQRIYASKPKVAIIVYM